MSNTYPEIIGIGSTVYDTLMVVDRYPTEDTKLEDLETKVQKMTDKYIADIDKAIEEKTKEIMTV